MLVNDPVNHFKCPVTVFNLARFALIDMPALWTLRRGVVAAIAVRALANLHILLLRLALAFRSSFQSPFAFCLCQPVPRKVADVVENDGASLAWRWPKHPPDLLQV
jgi:hypothetical protein